VKNDRAEITVSWGVLDGPNEGTNGHSTTRVPVTELNRILRGIDDAFRLRPRRRKPSEWIAKPVATTTVAQQMEAVQKDLDFLYGRA